MNVDTVAEQLLFTTVRIETEVKPGTTGTGTGFFFIHTVGGNQIPFLVTNKHVVAGAKSGTVTFHTSHEGKPDLGKPYRLQIVDFDQIWFPHPDAQVDVAIAPVAGLFQHAAQAGVNLFYRSVDPSIIPAPEIVADLDALEEVVFIGYPAPIWDTVNYLPVIRRGSTATPIGIDYLGLKQFLVDASVFPGSSGSPVFLFNKGIYSDRKGNAVVGGRLMFLGIVSGVYIQPEVNRVVMVPDPTADSAAALSKRMINLGIVFKASAVTEAIEAFLSSKGISVSKQTVPSVTVPAGP